MGKNPGIPIRAYRHIPGAPGIIELKRSPVRYGIKQQEDTSAIIHAEASYMINKLPGAPFTGLDIFLYRQAAISVQVPVKFLSLWTQVEFKLFGRRISRDDFCMQYSGQGDQ